MGLSMSLWISATRDTDLHAHRANSPESPSLLGEVHCPMDAASGSSLNDTSASRQPAPRCSSTAAWSCAGHHVRALHALQRDGAGGMTDSS